MFIDFRYSRDKRDTKLELALLIFSAAVGIGIVVLLAIPFGRYVLESDRDLMAWLGIGPYAVGLTVTGILVTAGLFAGLRALFRVSRSVQDLSTNEKS